MTQQDLDNFIISARPPSEPIAVSQEIRDRGSTFIAHIYHVTTVEEAKTRVSHLKHYVHRVKPASHEIAAWRCMVPKPGRTGLGGPDDFEIKVGSADDGESWAGGKVLKVMQNQAIIDAVVIVSRWYGGVLLGPARFTHIETCALEVCRKFKQSEELREMVEILPTLDDILGELRAELAQAAESTADSHTKRKSPVQDYSKLDLAKAKRLVQARENAIKNVKSLLEKQRLGDAMILSKTDSPTAHQDIASVSSKQQDT